MMLGGSTTDACLNTSNCAENDSSSTIQVCGDMSHMTGKKGNFCQKAVSNACFGI